MSIDLINPDALPQVDVYRQVSVARGSRLVFVAGQVARNADGNRVGEGDLAAQVEQAQLNVTAALVAAGASSGDVAKLTVYVVAWSPDKMTGIMEGLSRAASRLGVELLPLPPVTLVGVAALAEPDLLVEIEAIAVLD